MYGYPRICSIDDVLAAMVKNMVDDGATITASSNVALSKLPLCRHYLVPNIKCVNNRVAQSDVKMLQVPSPKDHGWALNEDIIEPVWF